MFGNIESSSVLNDSKWIDSKDALIVALTFSGLSIILSTTHIVRHLKNYTMPQIQVYVIRILFTCPVYAVTSSLALALGPNGTYAEVLRDVYEALVLYSFLNLILEYAGGETDCVYSIENEPMLRMPCPLCLMKPRARDARLMRFCHRGVLQFILTKPVVAVVNVVMLATGQYFNPIYQAFEIVVYNISYGWALYCLFVFYLATKPVIKHFKPIAKFSTVKIIIFATYYQSMVLKLTLSTPEKAIRWNDFLLCGEMVIFSLLLMIAFPVKEFVGGIPDRRVLQNVKEVFAVRELFQDVYHNFNPVYRDYALQRSQTEAPPTVQIHTYFDMNPVAMEMTERYRGRSKRFAFNSLLRGTRPVRAGLRRQYGNPQDDLYHYSSTNNVDNNSIITMSSLHVDSERGPDTESSRVCDSRHSSFDSPRDREEEEGDSPKGSLLMHIGRLTLIKAARTLPVTVSSAARASHLLHKISVESMDQFPLSACAEASNYGALFQTEPATESVHNSSSSPGVLSVQVVDGDFASFAIRDTDGLRIHTEQLVEYSAMRASDNPGVMSPISISDCAVLLAEGDSIASPLGSNLSAVVTDSSPPKQPPVRAMRQASITEWTEFV